MAAGDVARENRVEKPILDSRIFQIQIPYEIFYSLFPAGFFHPPDMDFCRLEAGIYF